MDVKFVFFLKFESVEFKLVFVFVLLYQPVHTVVRLYTTGDWINHVD